MAVTGQGAELALQIALVHFLFNVYGVFAIYVLPFLRPIPLVCAEFLAKVATNHKPLALAWIVTVFLAIPALAILIHTQLT